METRRDVFQAIADPVRREIVQLIGHQPLTPNALSESFDVSRQAISKHLQILIECGLIEVKKQGRERHYQVRHEALDEVAGWLEKQRKLWTGRFDKMDQVLQSDKKKHP